jgi:hypothetical protein
MSKDYYFYVKNQLVQDPKHRQKMGDAIWLYQFYLSYANCQLGRANPGLTFYWKTCAKKLEIHPKIFIDWHDRLEREGYIKTKKLTENQYRVEIIKPINLCWRVHSLSTRISTSNMANNKANNGEP